MQSLTLHVHSLTLTNKCNSPLICVSIGVYGRITSFPSDPINFVNINDDTGKSNVADGFSNANT